MNILITGASGYLGTHLTNLLVGIGINVTAIVRREGKYNFKIDKNVKIVIADLLETGSLLNALKGVDVVIHCAAAMNGDYQFQYENTVLATENLIDSMEKTKVKRILLVGSYSVYDYVTIKQGDTLTENSDTKNISSTIGSYAKTKLMQEERVKQSKLDYTILRFGVIIGKPLPWVSQLGIKLGTKLILFGKGGDIPSISLFNCLSVFMTSINHPITIGKTYNLVDGELLERGQYATLLKSESHGEIGVFSIPYKLILSFVLLAQPVIYGLRVFKLGAPQILNLESFYERSKPLMHTSELFKKDTNWLNDRTFK